MNNTKSTISITIALVATLLFGVGLGVKLNDNYLSTSNDRELGEAKNYIQIHYRTRTKRGGCSDPGCCEFMGSYRTVSGFRCLEYKHYWIDESQLQKPIKIDSNKKGGSK